MSGLLVLHTTGDPDGGARWRAALQSAGWPEPWAAPDLPGHGQTPPPAGGMYDPVGAVVAAVPIITERFGDHPPVVAGHGTSAYAALVLALAGRASAVVLVDGLGGRWVGPAEAIDDLYAHLRGLLDDPAAMGPAPNDGSVDPRAARGFPSYQSRSLWEPVWRSTTVPTLVIETPSSPTPPEERGERIGCLGGTTLTVELADDDPASVIAAIARWAHG